ncbi:response regulator transcription factor [uncultured Fluviicola sp.]|uniref:LuxR C-terminal-related transcriptional regulator n=1 Tax=uncultured Fluviicola sp. TaxID=463303 RepID=UPI0025E81ECA|nr:response regulator transcription factor [uncultured Fluviicola sp.]
MNPTIKIAVAEDNHRALQLIETKLHRFEDLELVLTAENGQVLIQKLENFPELIDLVLMDIQMPVMDGIQATSRVKQLFPATKIMALTTFSDDEKLVNMILSGASGYLLKDISSEDLYKSILDVIQGGSSMSPSVAFKLLEYVKTAPRPVHSTSLELLTAREKEILELIKTGLQNKEIAEKLHISPQTVRKHLENIYDKLQVNNRVEAISKLG